MSCSNAAQMPSTMLDCHRPKIASPLSQHRSYQPSKPAVLAPYAAVSLTHWVIL